MLLKSRHLDRNEIDGDDDNFDDDDDDNDDDNDDNDDESDVDLTEGKRRGEDERNYGRNRIRKCGRKSEEQDPKNHDALTPTVENRKSANMDYGITLYSP